MSTHTFSFLTSSAKQRHRWLLGLPFFLAIAALSVLELSQGGEEASFFRMTAPYEHEVYTYADSSRAISLSEQTQLSGNVGSGRTLALGEVIFGSHGQADIQSHGMTFSVWKGDMVLVAYEDSFTVAALTSPVLITAASGSKMIVPVGMQWRGGALTSPSDGRAWMQQRSLSPIPLFYEREQMATVLKNPYPVILPRRSQSLSLLPYSILDPLRLTAAQSRQSASMREQYLKDLYRLVSDGKEDEVRAILRRFPELLTSDPASFYLPYLLSIAADRDMTPLFFAPFASVGDRWILATQHPATRAYAAVLTPPSLTQDTKRLFLAFYPFADYQPEAIPAQAVQAWADEWRYSLRFEQQDRSFLGAAFPIIADEVDKMRERQLLERAGRYREHLASLAALSEDELAVPQGNGLSDLLLPEEMGLEDDDSDEEDNEEVDDRVLDQSSQPRAVREEAATQLQQLGGMHTVSTVIEANGPQSARVQGIVFSTAQGDQTISFTLNTTQRYVSDIFYQGQNLPYGMPLEPFVRWLKGM